MHKKTAWAAIALTTLGLAGAAWANTNDKTTTSSTSSMNKSSGSSVACSNDDASKLREVMGFLHAANQAEIKIGNLAKEKASNADVKSFADQMVKEHTDADKKLTDLAKKDGIDLNAYAAQNDPLFLAIKSTNDTMSSDLSGKSGNAFEVDYLAPQVMDHELVLNVVDQGEKIAKSSDDKSFFSDARKMVTMHRDHAKTLVGKLQLQGTKGNPKAIGGGPASEGTSGSMSGSMSGSKGGATTGSTSSTSRSSTSSKSSKSSTSGTMGTSGTSGTSTSGTSGKSSKSSTSKGTTSSTSSKGIGGGPSTSGTSGSPGTSGTSGSSTSGTSGTSGGY